MAVLLPAQSQERLVRAIGRWGLTALTVNCIIGSGIFSLPSAVSALLGPLSPWAYLVAAAGVGVIMACFAEAGSQFAEAGGPYLYAREAFGRFAGIQVGWLVWLTRFASAGANANVFVQYLAQLLPAAGAPLARAAVLTLLMGGLALVNILGVKAGTRVSSCLAAAKLVPLAFFIVLGLTLTHGALAAPLSAAFAPGAPGWGDWLSAILLLVFAFGGFEAALLPMAEARDTRRDVPFALFTSLAVCAVFYTLIQVVVLRALGGAVRGDAPLAQTAQLLLGPAATAFISVGALLSVYGNLSSSILIAPRLTFALAERGDFPPFFSFISARFRTPYVSIVVFAVASLTLALFGSFRWNAVLSAVARLITYGFVCAAVPVLRRKRPQADAFRLPVAPLWSGVAIVFIVAAAGRMGRGDLIAVTATMVVALANWLWVRRRDRVRSAV
jgi:amino acid transporter